MLLTIGPLNIQIKGLTAEDIPANSRLFINDSEAEADATYTFHFVDCAAVPRQEDGWNVVLQRSDIIVFSNGRLEARLLAVGDMSACYALLWERSERETDIYFTNTLKNDLKIDTVFTSCLGIERRLARQGCYILHCAYLDYNGQAVLFSGPSGIGKSTHADLWCRNISGCKVLNGDRALLCPTADGGYEVCGWLVCGSSGICHNERRPLRAIVFIEQTATNGVRGEGLMEHFKRLTEQITINWWNEEFTRAALDGLLTLVGKTTVVTYGCNMEPEAAHTLRQHLADHGAIR